MGRLEGKTAIVTGAGQGIGRGLALELSREGAAVVVAEMDAATCQKTAEEIKSLGGKALAVICDVRKRDQVEATVSAAVREYGTVDILVNNAQSMRNQVRLEDTTDEDMALALESGLWATFYFMQACLPYMKKKGGKIINFGSAAGLDGYAEWGGYAAAKEGIRAITRVAAHEWGQYKINVNAICPLANTPKMKLWAESFPDRYQWMLSTIALGRLGDCERDIGRAVVFLASPDSDFVTGHTLMVDGGQTMLR